MKMSSFILALTVLTATVSTLAAADTSKELKPTKKTAVKKSKADSWPGPYNEKNTMLTGSYIKRDVRRQGTVTDGPQPVYVLDNKALELTGGADLSQVLVRSGFRR